MGTFASPFQRVFKIFTPHNLILSAGCESNFPAQISSLEFSMKFFSIFFFFCFGSEGSKNSVSQIAPINKIIPGDPDLYISFSEWSLEISLEISTQINCRNSSFSSVSNLSRTKNSYLFSKNGKKHSPTMFRTSSSVSEFILKFRFEEKLEDLNYPWWKKFNNFGKYFSDIISFPPFWKIFSMENFNEWKAPRWISQENSGEIKTFLSISNMSGSCILPEGSSNIHSKKILGNFRLSFQRTPQRFLEQESGPEFSILYSYSKIFYLVILIICKFFSSQKTHKMT